MRIQTMYLINVQLPEADQYKDPVKFMPFKFEKGLEDTTDIYIPTDEQWEEMDQRYAEIAQQKGE